MKAVTPRINKKIEPENSQVLLNSIINSTTDMIWSVDPKDFGLTMFNRGLSDYFLDKRGMTIKPGMRPEDLFPTDEFVQRWRGFYKQALKKGSFRTEYKTFSATEMLDLNIHVITQDDRVIGLSVFGRNITRQKQAEKTLLRSEDRRLEGEAALRESQDKFKYFFDFSNVGESITQVTGEVGVNRTFCEMLGYSEEELQNRKWQEITHPEDIDLTQREIDGLLSGEKDAARFNKRFLKKDGSVIWVDVNSSVRRDEAGKPLYLMTTLVDITVRKRAEEELRESELRFRTLIEQASIAITVSRNGIGLLANQKALELFGLQRAEEMIGRPIFEFFASQFQEDSKERTRRRGLGLPVPSEFEALVLRRDGSQFPVLVMVNPLQLSDGPANMSFVFDITERKRAEEELNYQAALLANVNDAIIASDSQFRMTAFNPAAEALYGWKAEEVIGRNGTEILRTEWPSVNADDMRRRIAEMGHWRGEGTQVLKDGTRIPVEMSSIVLRNKSGEITGYISMNRDIRERKRAETALQDYNAHLEEDVSTRTRELRDAQEQLVRKEKLAVLGQLAGGVGHELRNPLSVINTSIYYLKMVQPDADGKIKEHHAIIEREVQNADKIISDLLDYARVISSDQQAVAVAGLVRQTLERFPVPPGVKLTLKLPGDLPDVFADPFQVVQVLGNLVVNACQAMISQGSATSVKDSGRLTISTHEAAPVPGRGRKTAMVEIAVKDTGTGITPENMKSLFEPLFSTKITGIGLGLAVSKKLAEANGGGIEVESEAGKGSTFTLFLPVAGRQEK
jgi:PAS domain S-box-containing protein